MKKYLLALLLLTSVFAVAIDADYVQFATKSDFNDKNHWPDQTWMSSELISLHVPAGSTVYLTNYTSNFDSLYDIGDEKYSIYNPDTGMIERPGFDMSIGKYGYLTATMDENGNVISVSDFHPGNGGKEVFSFTGPDGRTVTTPGYLLDTFNEETDIFFVMTPLSSSWISDETETIPDATVNSYARVGRPYEGYNQEYLQSRQLNTWDQNGTPRVNFGTTDGVGHEFVIGYVASVEPPPSGQPLPGVLTSCLVALGATGIAARRRKQSRK